MALRYGAGAGLDLITIDGAPGGTGMSPWPMMNEWGIPAIYLHSLAYQFCQKLTRRGIRVPDIAVAGGFSTEDHVFKALALGSPYVKAVCMGRALMIPGMVGKNIGQWLETGDLPKNVAQYGDKVEEIFVSYEELKEKYGDDVKRFPLGAVGIYTFCQKFKAGLQQLMAGSRNFSLKSISRRDLMSLTEDAAKVTGIPYVMDAYRQEAEDILEDLGSFEREAGMIPLSEPMAVLRVLREGRRRSPISAIS
jgi:glutamate synthase domain-containing protein 2